MTDETVTRRHDPSNRPSTGMIFAYVLYIVTILIILAVNTRPEPNWLMVLAGMATLTAATALVARDGLGG